MNNLVLGGEGWTYYETIGGGQGGRPAAGRATPACTSACPTRSTRRSRRFELEFPLRVRRYELLPGTGGEGRHRGGDGVVREVEALEPAALSLVTERRRRAPRGAAGGEDGARGQNLVNGERSARRSPWSSRRATSSPCRTPGGGGWGGRGWA